MSIAKREGATPWTELAPPKKTERFYDSNIADIRKKSNPEASQFLDLLTEESLVTFQTFDDTKRQDKRLVRILHGTLDQHMEILHELNSKGAGVFFTVNQTDLQGRQSKNVTRIRSFFIDLDGASLDPVLSAPLEPHIIVESSPGRYHAYWIVEGAPLNQFSIIQKKLISKFSADPCVHDLPRVMRLPGFFHNKQAPFMVRVIQSNKTLPYLYEGFIKAFEISKNNSATEKTLEIPLADPILEELKKQGLLGGELPNKLGGWDVICPWVADHTTGNGGTAYFEAHTNRYSEPGFKCQHSHCQSRNIEDLKAYLGIEDTWETPVPLVQELLPVSPFRENMLPKVLRDWLIDIAERMQVPLDYLGASVVVILGSLIGRKFGIFPKAHDDWLVIPNLWGAVVGRPSLLKSPTIDEVMKPLKQLADEAVRRHEENEKDLKQQTMWYEAQFADQKDDMKKAAKRKDKKKPSFDSIEPPTKPALKRYITGDGTVEKIGEILLENPQGVLLHRDELIAWFKGLDKYGREGDRGFYLESWNGNGSYVVDRIGRGTLMIPALCLSIIGGIVPGRLREYAHQAKGGGEGDDGLLQRFQLLVWPDQPGGYENIDREPDQHLKQKVFEIVQKIDSFEPFEPSSDQGFKTHTFRFSAEAQKEFDAWRTSLEERVRKGDLEPSLESHLAKYRSLMPSLALIFYLVETLGAEEKLSQVDKESVLRAIQWCNYLETHARRLYASSQDHSLESARELLKRIKKGDLSDGFTIRSVYNARHWTKLDKSEKVKGAVEVLEECGWVRTIKSKGIGASSTKVYVHPQIRRKL